jgi:hypothetical protein
VQGMPAFLHRWLIKGRHNGVCACKRKYIGAIKKLNSIIVCEADQVYETIRNVRHKGTKTQAGMCENEGTLPHDSSFCWIKRRRC